MAGKTEREGGKVFIELLGGVPVFLSPLENFRDVLSLPQGQFKTS
jgi:hypothetical protein